MQMNPPPVIVLYRQSLNIVDKKNYAKNWQQEPQEVKEFFSNVYHSLKQTKLDISSLFYQNFEELDTSDHSLFNELSAISFKPFLDQSFESNCSIKELLHQIDDCTQNQSAFYKNNSIGQISALCQRLKSLNMNESIQQKLDASFVQISKIRLQ